LWTLVCDIKERAETEVSEKWELSRMFGFRRDEVMGVTVQGSYSCQAVRYVNYWVMHPVTRVSIKYCNNLRTQQSIF
jgi:hypothetical protein